MPLKGALASAVVLANAPNPAMMPRRVNVIVVFLVAPVIENDGNF